MGILAKSPGVLYDGATSLVDLIKRQFGDDIDGATQELVRMGGFPESVARRIATGELPMDEASRVARREARYADEGLVHVNRGGIQGEGFDNSRLPWDDPDTPFNAHWFTTDPHPTTAFRKQGSDDPLTYTPVVLEKGRRGDWRDVVKYGESMGEEAGYGTEFREGLLNNGVSDLVVRGGDKIEQSTIDALPVGGRLKVDPDNKYGDRKNSLVKNEDGSLGFYEGSEHILDYDDLADYQRFNPEIQDVAVLDNTIIRSPNAAFDPEYTGSNIMGGLLAGGVGLGALGQSEDADAGFVTRGGKTLLEAFHGSPHKFDRFSMDQIGAGEGAQAYGHGLYFADSEDVARGYRERLAGSDGYYNGQRIADMGLPTESPEVRALSHAEGLLRDGYTDDVKADTLAYFQDDLDQWLGYRASLKDDPDALKHLEAEITDRKAALEAAKGIDYSAINTTPNGHLYRAEIDVTPESLLDWDKPLSEQSEAVRNAVQDIAANGDARFTDQQLSKLNESLLSTESGNSRGQSIVGILGDDYSVDPRTVDSAYSAAARSFKEYDYPYETALEDIKGAYPDAKPEELAWALKKEYGIGGQAGASSALSDRGIKGIKYLDGSSRHPTQAEADIANEIRELEKKREIAGFMSGTPDVPDLSDSIKSLDGDIASRRQALKEMEDARQTSNYVIFDDSLINIAERGNATVPMLATTAGLSGGGLLAASLAAPEVKDSGMISAPRSEGLFNLTMGARDLERRLEGSPASLLFPSGLVEYLETVNRREEDPNAMTRGMALLDVLPF